MKTVAIIDDDQDDLDIMQHVIRNIDPSIECIGFIYPEEALGVLLDQTPGKLPGYIFIDINMPGLKGDKCLELLRSKDTFENIKIIMYSTSMPDGVAHALKRSGADHVFEKPVRITIFTEILSKILLEA